MKVTITSVKPVVAEIIVTDEEEWPTYRRSISGNWENLMGESWESYYDSDGELEAAYQAFISTPSPHPAAGGDDG